MVLDILRALVRRWYLTLMGLAATVGLVFGAASLSPPEYTARGLILLLPGSNAVQAGGNPFLELGGLEQPGSIVVAYFASASAAEEIAEVSDTADFAVALDASTRGPVISVEVTDTTPAATISTLDFLMQRVPTELARLQSQVGAPAESVITSMPLVVDAEPEIDLSGTLRLAIAAGVLGLAATVALTFAIDAALQRRRSRRGTRGAGRTRRGRRPSDAGLDADTGGEAEPDADEPAELDFDSVSPRAFAEPVRAGLPD